MACSDYSKLIDFWTNWQWFDGINCFFADQLGQSVIAFIFFGVTGISLYLSTGSIVVPTVIGIIIGGVAFALLPAYGIEVGLILIVMVGGGAMYFLARRAALS